MSDASVYRLGDWVEYEGACLVRIEGVNPGDQLNLGGVSLISASESEPLFIFPVMTFGAKYLLQADAIAARRKEVGNE